jgi:hypothetical protein
MRVGRSMVFVARGNATHEPVEIGTPPGYMTFAKMNRELCGQECNPLSHIPRANRVDQTSPVKRRAS